MASRDEDDASKTRPEPDDFDRYVPWACNQLQIDTSIIINKVQQNEYVSVAISDRSKSRAKLKPSAKPSQAGQGPEFDKDEKSALDVMTEKSEKEVKLLTVYDNNGQLVQIKFERNRQIPQILMKVCGIIIQFHIYLTSVVINRGLDKYIMHELHKMLPMSHITELCLDDTFLKEVNYYILLDTPNSLKHLSLARCKLGDVGVKEIATRLIYPAPASKTLHVLNLSSNRISDIGAKYLADALRSNRQLYYLNLASNMIKDDGAMCIFDMLKEFPLTNDEILNMKERHMKYLLEREEVIENLIKELRYAEFEKRTASKRKSTRGPQIPLKKLNLKGTSAPEDLQNGKDFKASLPHFESMFYEKAEQLALTTIGEYDDPFSSNNTYLRDNFVYCFGNNSLCYLNLAYNELSYCGLKKLCDTLQYQKTVSRKPRGLINAIIEGNPLPVQCWELVQVDDLLDSCLSMAQGKQISTKKKPPPKSGK